MTRRARILSRGASGVSVLLALAALLAWAATAQHAASFRFHVAGDYFTFRSDAGRLSLRSSMFHPAPTPEIRKLVGELRNEHVFWAGNPWVHVAVGCAPPATTLRFDPRATRPLLEALHDPSKAAAADVLLSEIHPSAGRGRAGPPQYGWLNKPRTIVLRPEDLPGVQEFWHAALARPVVTVPWWTLSLAFFLPPVGSTLWILVRRKPQPGRCRVCGYDLRATPDRCPECGTAAAADRDVTAPAPAPSPASPAPGTPPPRA